jgi:plastocyanin
MIRRWTVWAIAAWLCSSAPAWGQCVGDCDESGSVAVNELVIGVNIALSRAAVDSCASLDTNGDGQVAINELIGAVGNALRGCGFAGRYTAAVELDGGATGTIELAAAPDGHATGSLTIDEPAAVRARLSATVVSISGDYDPTTGSFLVTGSFRGPGGEIIMVRLSGQLGGEFMLQIGDVSYSSSFATRATPTPTPTATPSGAVHMVKVGQPALPFDPEVLEINPGDTVVWMWVQGTHSVRSAELNTIGQPSCTASGLFDSGAKSSGTFSYTFTTPGRYGFHCGVAGHCENFESGYIDVRGTPSPTPTRTWTASPTIAIPTSTPTPETIGGVSTRMLGTFSGVASVGTQMLPARLQIQVNDGVVTVSDVSAFPNLFPNPLQMTVLSPTSLSYASAGPPPIAFTLSLNAQGHVVGRYTVTDPIMPHLPIDYDVTREETSGDAGLH